MADKIDKSLTQGPRGRVDIPAEEEITEAVETSIEAQEQAPGPVEVTEQEDGSVEVDFDPNATTVELTSNGEFTVENCTFINNSASTNPGFAGGKALLRLSLTAAVA